MKELDLDEIKLREELSAIFGNGSGDDKAYADINDIFYWVQAHDQNLIQTLKAKMPKEEVTYSGDRFAEIRAARNEVIKEVNKILDEL